MSSMGSTLESPFTNKQTNKPQWSYLAQIRSKSSFQGLFYLVAFYIAFIASAVVIKIKFPDFDVGKTCGENLIYYVLAVVGAELVDPASISSTADCGFLSYPSGKSCFHCNNFYSFIYRRQ